MIKFINGKVYTNKFKFENCDFVVEKDRFSNIIFDSKIVENKDHFDETIDLKDKYVIPGLVDIHTHGAVGIDFSVCSEEDINKVANYYAKNGISSFLFTTTTMSYESLKKQLFIAKSYLNNQQKSINARMLGIYLEGPFLSKEKKGAQAEEFLINPNLDVFSVLNDVSGNSIKIVCVAPELDGAMNFIKEASKNAIVSLAHTDCDYNVAKESIHNGAIHLTHMFNAMNQIEKREPGPIPAFAENDDVFVELICDGIHVDPAIIRLAFGIFGSDKICIISDSLSLTGSDDLDFEFSNRKVFIDSGICRFSDGTIAGSITNIFEGMRRAISFGVDKEIAIKSATFNPAKSIGMEGEIGSIEVGKYADFVICDDEFNIIDVYINGIKV